MRGTGAPHGRQRWWCRFIPACAGNSCGPACPYRKGPVHPRVCGEQPLIDAAARFAFGSSPRVRGTGAGNHPSLLRFRFIPACAGNRLHISSANWLWAVHPRVCGEQFSGPFPRNGSPGSSPRVRGTVLVGRPEVLETRFIPACAGNSSRSPIPAFRRPVHPRVCGEQHKQIGKISTEIGSSPRVRGTAHFLPLSFRHFRFIPACAGNSILVAADDFPAAVHPRVCGEQRRNLASRLVWIGSSPRVRGTDAKDMLEYAIHRFIPACAGNRLLGSHCSVIIFTMSKDLPMILTIFRGRTPDQVSLSTGEKTTSFMPSKSTGLRRL